MTTLWPEQRLQEVEARLKSTPSWPAAVLFATMRTDLADAVAEIRRLQAILKEQAKTYDAMEP